MKKEGPESAEANRREWTHLTLFVPATPGSLRDWQQALETRGLTLIGEKLQGKSLPFSMGVEWVENPKDGSFAHAFSLGTATAEQQGQIDATPGALVLSIPVDLHKERAAIASLVHTLAACGAQAVRIEQSKLGYPVERWLQLVDGKDPWSLYRAVVMVIESNTTAGTCGMQVFSLPDAQMTLDEQTDAVEANKFLGILNVYQIQEDPVLVSGHTFSPTAGAPKRVLHRWPDANYPSGHACHNPFGVWHIGPPGSKGAASKLAVVFMPSLVSMLMATEQKAGRPLTQKQVEELTAKCPCITMEHRHAQAMERSRGHADIDPERVWEQWQISRRQSNGRTPD
jgi:hypothetical protein